MAKLLNRLLTSGPFYVRISPELLSVRDISQRRSIEGPPLVALSNDKAPSILAIGDEARRQASMADCVLMNPFDHPRTILKDFTSAEQLLRRFIVQLAHNALFKPSPLVIMHPLEKLDGGLTQIEVRALQELALGAGARQAAIWTGKELSDVEIEMGRYPGDHWLPAKPTWA